MPKLDLDAIEQTNRTGYPMPYAAEMAGRLYRKVAGPAGKLTARVERARSSFEK